MDAVRDHQSAVRGRFAPTPSGPLHFGSLVAALASCLDVRSRGGEWLLRIDDLDREREVAGARETILDDLGALGFTWDGPVYTQYERGTRYREAVNRLLAENKAFPCACSRSEINEQTEDDEACAIYPGTCRDGLPPGREARSIRLRIPDCTIAFDDEWAGRIQQDLAREVGDFVVWRVEDIASYHLATVLDDADAGITRIVRGADLLGSTPRQILLQRLLGLPSPDYAHFPLVRMVDGRKLGKQTHAPRIDTSRPARTLLAALDFLHQSPPPELASATVDDVWSWALSHWHPVAVNGGT
ncbi:MAG: tRNA glutamyl-Q(34) synthetase GluQRS [Gammaproteobacteria bacterium]